VEQIHVGVETLFDPLADLDRVGFEFGSGAFLRVSGDDERHGHRQHAPERE
jgi:hypothetical protein